VRLATFLTRVEQSGGLRPEIAQRAAQATLRTLAERITGGEARDIALFLPRELRPLLEETPEQAEGFDLDEFLRRVAKRAGVDEETALRHARAVFAALGDAVTPGELHDMVAQLPRDYEPLLASARVGRRRAMEADDLAGRVAELGGLDREAAARALDTVVETLAVRLSAGEVEDLAGELPGPVRPTLRRGLAERRAATAMTADEFVGRVAARERVDRDVAERHVRTVFAVLREALSEAEWEDLEAQLSHDYEPLLALGAR
jgi:uncharacterized protein (DUF2267 family)